MTARLSALKILTVLMASGLSLLLAVPSGASGAEHHRVQDTTRERVVAPRSSSDFQRVSQLPLGGDARERLVAERKLKARLRVSDPSPAVGAKVVFRTRGSKASRGLKVLKIRFGDGKAARARSLRVTRLHAYAKPGSYTATLVVKDRSGRKAQAQRLILVGPKNNDDTFGFGVEPPNPEDEVGITLDAPGSDVGAPASVDLRSTAMPVQHQGSVNSCVSWTTAYAMVGWYYRQKYGQSVPFAPMYVYSQTYSGLMGNGMPNGSHPKAAYEVLQSQGVDTKANYGAGWATAWNVRPTAAQRNNAAKYRISGWGHIFNHATGWSDAGVGTSGAEIEAIKSRLATGTPVALSFRVRQNFQNYTSGWYTGSGPVTGLHEMLALGYDQTGLIIQNSWGTGHGVSGYTHMTWAAVQRDVYEATFMHGLAGTTSTTDSVKPTMSTFNQRFAAGYVANNAQGPMTFSWSGTDNVGVTKYLLYYRIGGGDWAQLPITDTQTSATYNLSFGTSYQFAVAAYDSAGNLSDWAMGSSFTPGNYAENVASYSSGWFVYSDAAFMNGTLYESSQANATMTVQITGTNFGLVSTQGTGGGRAYVYLDGAYQFTIDNYTTTASHRVVVAWLNFGAYGTHTVQLVVEGTPGRPYVDVDSFLVS